MIVVGAKAGTPIYLFQIADVLEGHDIRRGAVTWNGHGECVLGLGFHALRENSHKSPRPDRETRRDRSLLPPGVRIVKLYDRTGTRRSRSIEHRVYEPVSRVGCSDRRTLPVPRQLSCWLDRGSGDSLSMMFAFIGMWKFAIAGSLLSPGLWIRASVVDSSRWCWSNTVSAACHRRMEAKQTRRDPGWPHRGPQADASGELIIPHRVRSHPHARRRGRETLPADGP